MMSDSHASHKLKTCMMQHQSLTPSYQAMITSMRARYPNLASLDDELSDKSKDPESGRAAVLEFYPDCVKRRNFQTSNDLLKYIEKVSQNNGTCKRRLYLLEGLPRNYIEILGSQLKIEPYLFAQQLRRVIWDDNKRVGNSPFLHSHPSAARTLGLRYTELRDFGDQISDFEVTCFSQPRGISVTKVKGEFDGVGIIPKMATFWYERKGDDEWDALVLLDPPVGNTFWVGEGSKRKLCTMESQLYQGGYVDFAPGPNTGPQRIRTLDDLCYYWMLPGQHLRKGGDCLTSVLCVLKTFVASHWVLQLRYFDRISRELQFGISRAKDLSDLAWLERCWSDAHSWNARLADSIEFIESSQSYLDLKGPALRTLSRNGTDDWDKDFKYIAGRCNDIKRRMEYLISSMTGLISIIESRRSLQETKSMKALTLLGMIFIPLAFTSGIFGMSGKYAAGETYFWVYFAVALPLVLLVFIMAYVLNKVSWWRETSR